MFNLKKFSTRLFIYFFIGVIGLSIFFVYNLPRLESYIKTETEAWIRRGLKEKTGISAQWTDLRVNLVKSRIVISNLTMVKGQAHTSSYFISEKVTAYYSPVQLIRRLLYLRTINIQGLSLSLHNPEEIWTGLKGTEVGHEWKVRCRRIEIQEGKSIIIGIPDKEIFINTKGVYFSIDGLHRKKSHPFTLLINNGKIKYKSIDRTLTYGKIKGELDLQKLSIKESRLDLEEDDGYLKWIGDLHYKSPFLISGSYSGSVKSKTLAYFWKCFKQMEGQVTSRGKLIIKDGEKIVHGNLSSPSFRWWKFPFQKVRGEFLYKNKNLIFKNVKGYYYQAKTKVSATVNLAQYKANVGINTSGITLDYLTKSFVKKTIEYPDVIKDRLWNGELILNLDWPNKALKTKGNIVLEEIISDENVEEPIRLQSNFTQAKRIINFKPFNIQKGIDYLNCMGSYNFSKKQADLIFKGSFVDIYSIAKKIHGTATISGYVKGVAPRFNL
ncbi:MAG: hypothetical protein ACMUIP_09450, partial [bacterium]